MWAPPVGVRVSPSPYILFWRQEITVKVTTERTPNCQAIVTVEVDEEQIAGAMRRAAQKVSRIRPIPGFRPGKAPYERIERAIGKDLLRDEAIEDLGQTLYKQVLTDENIEPYDTGKLDVAQKEPLILKFTIPTRPVVTLGAYRDIHMQPAPVQVTDEEVNQIIEQARTNQATMTPVTRPAQLKDLVTFDVKGGIAEQTPLDRQGLELTLETEKAAFPWLAQLVGMELNETRTITYTYPDDNSVNAGKVATYTVTVHAIKEPQLPALDDEFAKSVSSFETLEQLKARIRENTLSQKQGEEDNRFADQVVDAVVAQAQVAFPASMVEDEVDLEVARSRQVAQRLGLSWDKFLQLSGKDDKAFREDIRPRAETRVKRLLTLMELANAENITISGKDVDVEIDRRAIMAEAENGNPAQTRRALATTDARRDIEFSLRLGKTMERIIAIAKGEPTSGKILTPEMVRAEMHALEQAQAAQQAQTAAPTGLITDPSQVSSQNWPRGLDKPLVPGQDQ